MLAIVLTLAHRHTFSSSPNDALRGPSARATTPHVRHVFVINIENKGFRTTWGPHSAAPYLAKTLRTKGVLLTQYYGTAHHSLGNYLAQISGQGPTYATQHDCPIYTRFHESRPVAAPGQVVGNGCVYPKKVGTLPEQLAGAGLSWRGYMQDMARPCQHSRLGTRERWASATRATAVRHAPQPLHVLPLDHRRARRTARRTCGRWPRCSDDLRKKSHTPHPQLHHARPLPRRARRALRERRPGRAARGEQLVQDLGAADPRARRRSRRTGCW